MTVPVMLMVRLGDAEEALAKARGSIVARAAQDSSITDVRSGMLLNDSAETVVSPGELERSTERRWRRSLKVALGMDWRPVDRNDRV